MATAPHVRDYAQEGYAVIRGYLPPAELAALSQAVDGVEADALAHGRSFRHGNLYYHLVAGMAGPELRMAQWACWRVPGLAAIRNPPALLGLLEPLLGRDVKQILHQLHWKARGTGSGGEYAWHQDSRSRRPAHAYRNLATSYVQTGLALDPHRPTSGCLRVVPGSHRLGEIRLKTDAVVLGRAADEADLAEVGLDPASVTDLLLEPGDLALWSPFLLHASGSNRSDHRRRLLIQGYARAADCDRGEWAFRDGEAVPLPGTPSLVHYEGLFDRPEPHYP
jgi:hypothetical protein